MYEFQFFENKKFIPDQVLIVLPEICRKESIQDSWESKLTRHYLRCHVFPPNLEVSVNFVRGSCDLLRKCIQLKGEDMVA